MVVVPPQYLIYNSSNLQADAIKQSIKVPRVKHFLQYSRLRTSPRKKNNKIKNKKTSIHINAKPIRQPEDAMRIFYSYSNASDRFTITQILFLSFVHLRLLFFFLCSSLKFIHFTITNTRVRTKLACYNMRVCDRQLQPFHSFSSSYFFFLFQLALTCVYIYTHEYSSAVAVVVDVSATADALQLYGCIYCTRIR